ncbi:MAG: AMP-binding protein [Deltaproteobacteria bacterium]|nr:AMP-binding protein [Deltaproteobacteria bacterium]
MLTRAPSYEETRAGFRWDVPAGFNMGVAACDRWADGSGRLALIYEDRLGAESRYTFDDLCRSSNRAANVFRAAGVEAGGRVGILLPQAPETAAAHLAAYKAGAVAVPLFTLFGVDALEYRLADCAARVVVTDAAGAAKIADIRDRLPELRRVYCVDGPAEGGESFPRALESASDAFEPVDTRADDPALLIYTSGTTGKPKGALHAHRVLLGHLPGVEMSHDFYPQPGDLLWTPADWAWIGGLLDVLLPAWFHGMPVLARRFEKFDPEAAFDLLARHGVRNSFLPPTALKMLRAAAPAAAPRRLALRTVASSGESLGGELLEWGRAVLGVAVNEFYGQTECNMVLSSCGALFEARPGAIGKAVPGHRVAIVDDRGIPVPDGEAGQIAVAAPDPVTFLGYWQRPEATAEKYAGGYLLTGDRGHVDADGFVFFHGRTDDIITSAGYRIGPGPIEDCLLTHPAVSVAAVVGVPDPERTELVKAFLVLKPGYEPSEALTKEIQAHVKVRLAAHEYPRLVRYVDALPLTTTGKIVRRELRLWKD